MSVSVVKRGNIIHIHKIIGTDAESVPPESAKSVDNILKKIAVSALALPHKYNIIYHAVAERGREQQYHGDISSVDKHDNYYKLNKIRYESRP